MVRGGKGCVLGKPSREQPARKRNSDNEGHLPFCGFGKYFIGNMLPEKIENDIQTVEALRWSWLRALKRGSTFGLLGGSLAIVVIALMTWAMLRKA